MRRTFSRPDSLSRRAKPLSRAKRETRYTAARKAPRARAENNKIFLRMVIEQFGLGVAGDFGPQDLARRMIPDPRTAIFENSLALRTLGAQTQPCRIIELGG